MFEIRGSCEITSQGVNLNGYQVLENSEEGASGFFNRIYAHLQIQYPKYHKMDMLSKLGFLAAEILMQNLSGVKEKHSDYDCSVLLSNRWASLHTDQLYWQSVQQIPSPSLFVCTLPNVVSAEICIRHKFKGENHFFVSETFDESKIKNYLSMLFKNGESSFCLYGWVDFFEDQYNCRIFAVEKSIV